MKKGNSCVISSSLQLPPLRTVAGGYRKPRNEYDRFVLKSLQIEINMGMKRSCTSAHELLGFKVDMLSWLLENGQFFQPERLPRSYRSGERQACFMNSQELALAKQDDLVYVEGIGLNLIHCRHAWCCDRKGRVIDTTWHGRSSKRPCGQSYFGVGIEADYVREAMVTTGYYEALLNVASLARTRS